MNNWPNPFIEQRADPLFCAILKPLLLYCLGAGIRPAGDPARGNPEGLRDAEPVVVMRAPQSGPMSQLIWAPTAS